MTYHAVGAVNIGASPGVAFGTAIQGPHFTDPMSEQRTALYRVANDALKVLLSGEAGTVEIPPTFQGQKALSVRVLARPSLRAIGDNVQAKGVAAALVSTLIDNQSVRVSKGQDLTSFRDLTRSIPQKLSDVLDNAGDPYGCLREYEQSISVFNFQPSKESSTGTCRSVTTLRRHDSSIKPGCLVTRSCRRHADGSVVEHTLSPADRELQKANVLAALALIFYPKSKTAPHPTPEEIERAARAERIKAEVAAANDAILTMMREFGIDPNSDSANGELAATLREYGFTVEESRDWLAACAYQTECFYLEMYDQLDAAEERGRRKGSGVLVATLALAAIGLGVAVKMGRG